MAKTFPFFFTWCKQNGASHFQVIRAKNTTIETPQGPVQDLSSLSFQASFGQTPQAITNEIAKQMEIMPMASAKAVFPLKSEVTEKLIELINCGEGKIFYTVSGAESVENALKMARQVSGKKMILARQISYHGASLGALSVTGDWRNPPHLTLSEYTVRIPEPTDDPDLTQTRKIILDVGPEKIAAIILESITGGNGVFKASKEWWQGIRKLCDEFGILLIADEVICGFWRTGLAFGFQHFGIRPDFITLAKGISGGVIPFGAVWVSAKVAQYYDDNIMCCGLTNYSTPLGLAALKGVFSIIEDKKFQSHLVVLNQYFHQRLQRLQTIPVVKEIRIVGMLAAIDLHHYISWDYFIQKGLYLLTYQKEKRIVLSPSLTYDLKDFEQALDQFEKALKEYHGQ